MSVLLLHSRLAPELITGAVKKSKSLGSTVLKHRADHQQTKSFVFIWCSSCPKVFVCCCSAYASKPLLQVVYFFWRFQWQAWTLAHSPAHHVNKFSPAIQYVWFGWHWGLEKSLMARKAPDQLFWLCQDIKPQKAGTRPKGARALSTSTCQLTRGQPLSHILIVIINII